MAWFEDPIELQRIKEIKSSRPLCEENYPHHTWVKYSSEHKQVCVVCGYEEELICNDQ